MYVCIYEGMDVGPPPYPNRPKDAPSVYVGYWNPESLTYVSMYACIYGWMDEWMKDMYVGMDGCIYGWMDVSMYGWMDGS